MITLHSVNSTDTKALAFIQPLYEQSFPLHERRNFSDVTELLLNHLMQMILIRNDGIEIGFIVKWKLDSFNFVEHFAIHPSHQGKGLGAAAFKKIMQSSSKQLVVETELPENATAIRRIKFYEKCGLTTIPFTYMQPPYHEGDTFFPMQLMSRFAIDIDQFNAIKTELYQKVYHCF